MNSQTFAAPTKLKIHLNQMPSFKLLVPSVDIINFAPRLNELSKTMFQIMEESDGIGLAAPQIGYNICFVVLGSKLMTLFNTTCLQNALFVDSESGERYYALVNPKITYFSENKVDLWQGEGCLSLQGAKLGKVLRSQTIKIKYQNMTGHLFEEELSNHVATVVQHEIDHLHGILYPARMKEVEKISLMAHYLKHNRLNHVELINFNDIMMQNLSRYTAQHDISYNIADMIEYSSKINLSESNTAEILAGVEEIN